MNSISTILLITGSILLIAGLLPKVSNFLDVRSIFTEHFLIFKGSPLQLISIFLVPILFAVAIAGIRCVNNSILDNLNIVLSILISLFFSVLSILCAFMGRNSEKYRQLLKETFNAAIFEGLLCLLLLFISFITLFIGDFSPSLCLQIVSGTIYYLTMVVILNILVIIKRIRALFSSL